LFGALRHAIHFNLQLLSGDRPLPVILQRLRLAQIICDLFFELRLRHHSIQRWLGIGSLFGPDAMTPVNVFNRSLISYALYKRQSGSCRMRSFRWRFGMEESQHCSGDHGADCR
jgi:hypothetical protein